MCALRTQFVRVKKSSNIIRNVSIGRCLDFL